MVKNSKIKRDIILIGLYELFVIIFIVFCYNGILPVNLSRLESIVVGVIATVMLVGVFCDSVYIDLKRMKEEQDYE